jgi:hypothetical protein
VRDPYPSIGEKAVGRWGRVVSVFSITVTLYGGGCVFIVLIAQVKESRGIFFILKLHRGRRIFIVSGTRDQSSHDISIIASHVEVLRLHLLISRQSGHMTA